jgi:DNA-binding CsgD family transcriptional regulator
LNRFFTIIIRRPIQSEGHSLEIGETKHKKTKINNEESQIIEEQVNLSDNEVRILTICAEGPHSSNEILDKLGYKVRPGSYKKSLKKLIDLKILVQTLPDKPTSPNQKYETKGNIVKIIKNVHKPLTDDKEAQAERKRGPS